MPWKETHVEEQRLLFIGQYLKGGWHFSALCREFEISRKTGYVWIARYNAEGLDGLKDRSRAPLRHPNEVSAEIEKMILRERRKHRCRGAVTIRKTLADSERLPQGQSWPAPSTINAILLRHGLLKKRVHAPRLEIPPPSPLTGCIACNSRWSVDFKGQFPTGDGQLCFPFTMLDNYSRYLLRVQALAHPDFESVQALMVAAFRNYGLPEVIRSDNGAPFASHGLAGLSRLSVWWIRNGVRPERIQRGKPQQNGRHERMHRTLKEEATRPPKANLRAQQKEFDRFVKDFNYTRPHAALDLATPASRYEASPREYRQILPEICYRSELTVRTVRHNGQIKWKGDFHYISESLIGEYVALEETQAGEWTMYYGPGQEPMVIAKWNERLNRWRTPEVRKDVE